MLCVLAHCSLPCPPRDIPFWGRGGRGYPLPPPAGELLTGNTGSLRELAAPRSSLLASGFSLELAASLLADLHLNIKCYIMIAI
jgi:hypothetical protein